MMQTGVLSAPVPAVVGMAMSGSRGCVGARPAPIGGLRYSARSPSFVASRFIALAVSITDPPPTATQPSGRSARAHAPASRSDSSVGSMWTSVKVIDAMPAAVSERTARSGSPVAVRPGSLTTATRRSPSAAAWWPSSSKAPRPKTSGGAAHVKTVSDDVRDSATATLGIRSSCGDSRSE